MTTVAQCKFNNILGIAGSLGSNALSLSKNGSKYGSLFGYGFATLQGLGNMATTDNEQEAVAGYVQFLMGAWQLLSSFIGGGQSAKATKEVQENAAEIAKSNVLREQIANLTNEEIKNILTEVMDQVKNIEEAIEEINKIKESDEITEQQDAIQEEKAKIQEQVNIINQPLQEGEDPEAAKTRRNDAIQAIFESVAQISIIATTIQTIVDEKITEQTAIVTDATTNINTKTVEAQSKLAEELNNLSTLTVETSTEGITKVTICNTKAAAEGTGAATAQAAAAAASSNVFTAAAAPELERKAIDLGGASTTHIAGAATNMTALGSFLSNASTDYANVATLATTIGEVSAYAITQIGAYAAKSAAVIESVGSWTSAIEAGSTTITSSLDKIRKVINEDDPKKATAYAEEHKDEKFEPDLSYLDTGFGI